MRQISSIKHTKTFIEGEASFETFSISSSDLELKSKTITKLLSYFPISLMWSVFFSVALQFLSFNGYLHQDLIAGLSYPWSKSNYQGEF